MGEGLHLATTFGFGCHKYGLSRYCFEQGRKAHAVERGTSDGPRFGFWLDFFVVRGHLAVCRRSDL